MDCRRPAMNDEGYMPFQRTKELLFFVDSCSSSPAFSDADRIYLNQCVVFVASADFTRMVANIFGYIVNQVGITPNNDSRIIKRIFGQDAKHAQEVEENGSGVIGAIYFKLTTPNVSSIRKLAEILLHDHDFPTIGEQFYQPILDAIDEWRLLVRNGTVGECFSSQFLRSTNKPNEKTIHRRESLSTEHILEELVEARGEFIHGKKATVPATMTDSANFIHLLTEIANDLARLVIAACNTVTHRNDSPSLLQVSAIVDSLVISSKASPALLLCGYFENCSQIIVLATRLRAHLPDGEINCIFQAVVQIAFGEFVRALVDMFFNLLSNTVKSTTTRTEIMIELTKKLTPQQTQRIDEQNDESFVLEALHHLLTRPNADKMVNVLKVFLSTNNKDSKNLSSAIKKWSSGNTVQLPICTLSQITQSVGDSSNKAVTEQMIRFRAEMAHGRQMAQLITVVEALYTQQTFAALIETLGGQLTTTASGKCLLAFQRDCQFSKPHFIMEHDNLLYCNPDTFEVISSDTALDVARYCLLKAAEELHTICLDLESNSRFRDCSASAYRHLNVIYKSVRTLAELTEPSCFLERIEAIDQYILTDIKPGQRTTVAQLLSTMMLPRDHLYRLALRMKALVVSVPPSAAIVSLDLVKVDAAWNIVERLQRPVVDVNSTAPDPSAPAFNRRPTFFSKSMQFFESFYTSVNLTASAEELVNEIGNVETEFCQVISELLAIGWQNCPRCQKTVAQKARLVENLLQHVPTLHQPLETFCWNKFWFHVAKHLIEAEKLAELERALSFVFACRSPGAVCSSLRVKYKHNAETLFESDTTAIDELCLGDVLKQAMKVKRSYNCRIRRDRHYTTMCAGFKTAKEISVAFAVTAQLLWEKVTYGTSGNDCVQDPMMQYLRRVRIYPITEYFTRVHQMPNQSLTNEGRQQVKPAGDAVPPQVILDMNASQVKNVKEIDSKSEVSERRLIHSAGAACPPEDSENGHDCTRSQVKQQTDLLGDLCRQMEDSDVALEKRRTPDQNLCLNALCKEAIKINRKVFAMVKQFIVPPSSPVPLGREDDSDDDDDDSSRYLGDVSLILSGVTRMGTEMEWDGQTVWDILSDFEQPTSADCIRNLYDEEGSLVGLNVGATGLTYFEVYHLSLRMKAFDVAVSPTVKTEDDYSDEECDNSDYDDTKSSASSSTDSSSIDTKAKAADDGVVTGLQIDKLKLMWRFVNYECAKTSR